MSAQASLAPTAPAPAPTPSPTPSPTGGRALVREAAHRVFAMEFNASRLHIPGAGEKDPGYIVTPLGAKVNRIHVVGVCTDVEQVGESGEVWRARVSDPTGIFTVYAGNYQPEAAHALSQLQPPQYVAITGKARTYEPEPGSLFVSIRPESVTTVDEATRDQWILDAARRTAERLKASRAAAAEPQPSVEELRQQGIPGPAAEGALLARGHYGPADTGRYLEMARKAVSHLLPGGSVPVQRVQPEANPPGEASAAVPWKAPTGAKPEEKPNPEAEALDAAVLAAVQNLQGLKGARWDDVLAQAAAGAPGVAGEAIEESLNRLMHKGQVYEPTLGILKTT